MNVQFFDHAHHKLKIRGLQSPVDVLTFEGREQLSTPFRYDIQYQNQTVPQIVEKILRERHQMRGQDFVFNLKSEYPAREQVMQYGEDDLTFVSRLLSEVGIWFRFATDARLKIEVIEFYDDQSGYERGLTLPLRHPSGLFDGETEAVWGLNTAYSVVEKSVSTRDYNYREATAEMTTGQHDATGGDNTTYGEAYHYADNFLQQGDKEAAESGAFYARIRHERYLNEQAILKGQSTSSLLMPGLEIKVQGDDAPAVFRKGVLITGVTTSAARDRSYELTFTAIPYSERYGYRPALIPRPVMAGTLPARVTSTVKNDIYAHIDKDAFEEGNPDRPYIAGVKHDSAHTDHVTIQNYKRNVLRTPANNKIRLDDERGKEHIKVSTEYGGKSQLNLGHLVDAGKEQRGEGFELRTDLWGAVRAKKGIFISADAQDKAQGQVLEMQPALARLSAALVTMESLAASAQQAQALAADVSRQQTLLQQKIEQLQQEVLLGSAPKGVALVSGEDMQLSASDNLTLTAGKQLDIGVQKDFTLAAGKQLSLYSRAGAKLFSSHNDIDIQAQGGNLTTWSTQDTYISSGKKLVVTAQDELTLICGGGYIKIKSGNVEIGGPGKLLVKNAGIKKAGSGSMQGVMKSFEPESFDENFIISNPASGKPIANQKYEIHMPDGSVIAGITDAMGYSSLVASKASDDLKIILKK